MLSDPASTIRFAQIRTLDLEICLERGRCDAVTDQIFVSKWNTTMAESRKGRTDTTVACRSATVSPALGLAQDYFVFLRGLFNSPRAVSAPTPSSRALAAAIAGEADPEIPGTLVELGAGTGAVTEALLARGFAPDRIVAIEYEPVLAVALRRRCPGIQVFCDDAFRFEALLAGSQAVCAVVCGLPLLHFSQHIRQYFLSRALARQGSDQRYIQLSYSFRPPIIPREPDVAVTGRMVWRNLPPAHVWTYRRELKRDAAVAQPMVCRTG
jgi:phosphatidylethanolamine/phosphatidyl-N-methylethanolamine N-methyltransferase